MTAMAVMASWCSSASSGCSSSYEVKRRTSLSVPDVKKWLQASSTSGISGNARPECACGGIRSGSDVCEYAGLKRAAEGGRESSTGGWW